MISKSFTAVDQFEWCERQLYYKKVLKLPEEPNHYLAIGNLYHECIADALQRATPPAVADRLVEAKQTKSWSCPIADEKLSAEIVANLGRLRTQVFPFLTVREVETWSRKKYVAKIDCISETLPFSDKLPVPCVIDWKIKFSSKRRQQEDTDRSKQLALYCIETGLRHAYFVEVPRDLATPINVVGTSFEEEEIVRWERFFDAQFVAMQSRGQNEAAYKLAAPGHPLCKAKFCSYYDRCPGGNGNVAGAK